MPLLKARRKTKKAIRRAASKNISELVHHGKRKRSHKQIVAIALNAARGGKRRKKY